MKRILLYLLLFTGSFFTASAQEQQPDPARQEKMQALYVAYITKQLNLTETEAQKFWPVHTQFDSELKAVNINMAELERQQTVLNVKKKYMDRFTTILGNERANNFFRIDGEFRKKLVDELRKRRQQNNMNQPNKRRNF